MPNPFMQIDLLGEDLGYVRHETPERGTCACSRRVGYADQAAKDMVFEVGHRTGRREDQPDGRATDPATSLTKYTAGTRWASPNNVCQLPLPSPGLAESLLRVPPRFGPPAGRAGSPMAPPPAARSWDLARGEPRASIGGTPIGAAGGGYDASSALLRRPSTSSEASESGW